eukprot:TRINITY_DN11741_c0_g1_i1.p1 TRINITY_DN11741_c0_g1~~TRINITY_DN11741_c0_g1_i1.p1  ORF type:complete len:776 (-),score=82.60 TRINITY_DN11741_c0_g1_i1:147-2474(-)
MSSGVSNIVAFVQQVRRRLYVDALGRRNESAAPLHDNAQENVLKYVPWGWCCNELFKLFQEYPSGLTWAIILSELQLKWNDAAAQWRRNTETKKHIIDAIYEIGSIDPQQVLELTIEKVSLLPNTKKTHIATLTDGCSNRRLDWMIPEKYMAYTEAGLRKGVIRPPSKLLLTACTLLQPRSEADNLRIITHAAIVVPLKQEATHLISPMEFFTLFHDPGKNMTAVENEEHHSIRVKVCRTPPRSLSRRSSPVNSAGGSGPKSSISPRSSQESSGSQRIETRLYFVSAEAELEKSGYNPPQGSLCAFIDFHDQYSPLRAMFKEGDLIAIRYRTVAANNSVKSLIYDPDSVAIFLSHRLKEEEIVPMDITHGEGEIQSSQWKVPKLETGFRDYSYFPEQVRLRHLVGVQASNFGFLGRVLSMSCHMAKPDLHDVRHIVKMVELDERVAPLGNIATNTPFPTPPSSAAPQHTIDITLIGGQATELYSVRPGHILFFPALTTALHNGPPHNICAKATSSGVNLCHLHSMMSPGLISFTPLSALRAPQPPTHIIANVKLYPITHPQYLIHRKCSRGPKYLKVFPRMTGQQTNPPPILFRPMTLKDAPEIRDTPKQHLIYRCAFCAAAVDHRELDWCFAVDYSVFAVGADEQQEPPIRCSGSILANHKILGCTERDWQSWKFEVQDQAKKRWQTLEKTGLTATVLITHFVGEDGVLLYRIEDVHLREESDDEAEFDPDAMEVDVPGFTGYNVDVGASSKLGFITQQPQTNDDLDAISIEDA